MNIGGRISALAALALLGACEVNVDKNITDAVGNQAEALGDDLEDAAQDAGNTLSAAGDVVEDKTSDLRNGVDIDINTKGDADEPTAEKQ